MIEAGLRSTALGDDLGFLLTRASVRCTVAVNAALAGTGLRVREYSVLTLAAAPEHPSQRDLADYLRLDPSRVVSIVDGLEERGLVARRPNAIDRRSKDIVATRAGAVLLDRGSAAVDAAHKEIFGRLDATSQGSLRTLLARIAFED